MKLIIPILLCITVHSFAMEKPVVVANHMGHQAREHMAVSFVSIPREILELILIALTKAPSLDEAAKNIRSFMKVNRRTWSFFENPQTAGLLIKALENPLARESSLKAAIALATKGAQIYAAQHQELVSLAGSTFIQLTAINEINEKRDAKTATFIMKAFPQLANMHAPNNEPFLARAAGKGYFHATQALLLAGADLSTKDAEGWTALHCAANKGHCAVVQLLISAGAEVNTKSLSGWTALHRAAREGHCAVVQLLISAGAEVNTKGAYGMTALHCAALRGHSEIVEWLHRCRNRCRYEGCRRLDSAS